MILAWWVCAFVVGWFLANLPRRPVQLQWEDGDDGIQIGSSRGAQGRSYHLGYAMPVASPLELECRRETALHRRLYRLFGADVAIGDDVDERLNVASSSPAVIAALRSDRELRTQLRWLVAGRGVGGYRCIELTIRDGLLIVMFARGPGMPNVDLVHQTMLPRVRAIHARLPSIPDPPAAAERDAMSRAASVRRWLIVLSAVGAVQLVRLVWTAQALVLEQGELLAAAALAGSALWIALGARLIARLRNTPYFASVATAAASTGAFACFAIGLASVRDANIVFDTGASRPIIIHAVRSSRRITTYRMGDYGSYTLMRRGGRDMLATWHSGALGIAWVELRRFDLRELQERVAPPER